MPLTAFQAETLRLLATRRSPESFVAGAMVSNAGPDSPRYSKDVDIFHDVEESVGTNAEADAALLRQSGYKIEWLRTATSVSTGGSRSRRELAAHRVGIRFGISFFSSGAR